MGWKGSSPLDDTEKNMEFNALDHEINKTRRSMATARAAFDQARDTACKLAHGIERDAGINKNDRRGYQAESLIQYATTMRDEATKLDRLSDLLDMLLAVKADQEKALNA